MWFLLAPGPSMSAELAERVRGRKVIAVGNCFELAPWADVLVANDHGWWRKHPNAHEFAGRKFSGTRALYTEDVQPRMFGSDTNSGLLAIECARNLGATTAILLGYDMHGTHFFGKYMNGCGNTSAARRAVHVAQFQAFAASKRPGIEVVNCTPGSALRCFPSSELETVLG